MFAFNTYMSGDYKNSVFGGIVAYFTVYFHLSG